LIGRAGQLPAAASVLSATYRSLSSSPSTTGSHTHTHTHSSLAEEALWRRATSGLGAAGAQLVVIFLFFHYGSVSSGCNRRAINQHYFHIAAPPAPAAKTSVASAALPPPAGRRALRGPRSAPGRSVGRRGNVIDRGAAMFVRRVAVRRRADPRDPTRRRRDERLKCDDGERVVPDDDGGGGGRRKTRALIIFIFDVSSCVCRRVSPAGHVTADRPPSRQTDGRSTMI